MIQVSNPWTGIDGRSYCIAREQPDSKPAIFVDQKGKGWTKRDNLSLVGHMLVKLDEPEEAPDPTPGEGDDGSPENPDPGIGAGTPPSRPPGW